MALTADERLELRRRIDVERRRRIGDTTTTNLIEDGDLILAALSEHGALTMPQLRDAIGLCKRRIEPAVSRLVGLGEVRRHSRGVRGTPTFQR